MCHKKGAQQHYFSGYHRQKLMALKYVLLLCTPSIACKKFTLHQAVRDLKPFLNLYNVQTFFRAISGCAAVCSVCLFVSTCHIVYCLCCSRIVIQVAVVQVRDTMGNSHFLLWEISQLSTPQPVPVYDEEEGATPTPNCTMRPGNSKKRRSLASYTLPKAAQVGLNSKWCEFHIVFIDKSYKKKLAIQVRSNKHFLK